MSPEVIPFLSSEAVRILLERVFNWNASISLLPTLRVPELAQVPPLTFTVPLLPALLPRVPDVDVTMPPVIVRLPLPLLPMVREEEFVQLPLITFTVPTLPVPLPTMPLAFARMLPSLISRLPWLVLPTITVVLLEVSPVKVTAPEVG